MLETGVRPGEAVNLPWTDVYLQPAVRAKFGYIAIRGGKSRYAKRNLSLTAHAAEMLQARKESRSHPGSFRVTLSTRRSSERLLTISIRNSVMIR